MQRIYNQQMKGIDCVVCSEERELFGIGRCNHKEVCGVCHYLMRTKENKIDCSMCKMPNEEIFITCDLNKDFQSFKIEDCFDYGSCNIYFPSMQEKHMFEELTAPFCPFSDCEFANKALKTDIEFKKHIRERHRRYIW